VLFHLVLSLGYLVVTPAFEAPDEADHLRYASYVSMSGRLPIMRGTSELLDRPPTDEVTQAYHPPAYYLLLAWTMGAVGHGDALSTVKINPMHKVWEDTNPGQHLRYLHGGDEQQPVSPEIRLLWLLRGWSVLFGALVIVATHRLGRLAFPGEPVVADLAAVLLACLPKWSFLHGMINNGIPAASLSHVVILLLALGLVRRRLSPWLGLGLGLFGGAAILCKFTALFLLPVMFSVYVLGFWRWREQRRQIVVSALLALTALALVTAGFFLRNMDLYGSLLALDTHQLSFRPTLHVPPDQAWERIAGTFLPRLCSNMIGYLGWGTQEPARWLVGLSQALAALAVLGWILRGVSRSGTRDSHADSRSGVRWLLCAVSLVVFLVTVRYNLMMRAANARYLFPAIGPMAILFAAGLTSLGTRFGGFKAGGRTLALLLPFGIGVVTLWFHFRPDFEPHLAPADRWHASIVAGLGTAPGAPGLQLLEPPDGTETSEPPRFCWQADAADDAIYSVHIYREGGQVFIASYELFLLATRGGCWQMPPEGLAFLPVGEELRWKVRRVPDRDAGETIVDVPESRAFRLTILPPG